MVVPWTFARQVAAAVLVLVVTLTGVGRGIAGPPEVSLRIGSLAVPICHSGQHGAADSSRPGAPSSHDCCDACALCAPVTLPLSPDYSTPVAVFIVERRKTRASAKPHVSRVWTPRQAQGPPTT